MKWEGFLTSCNIFSIINLKKEVAIGSYVTRNVRLFAVTLSVIMYILSHTIPNISDFSFS